jgi:hypothetical protein
MNETRALLIISSSAESSLVGVWDSKSRMPSTNSLMVISLLRFLYAKEKEEKIFIGTHHARGHITHPLLNRGEMLRQSP